LYSKNDGETWTTLATGLTTTTYTLDTTTIADGTNILLKIQTIDSIGFVKTVSTETFLIANTPHQLSSPAILTPTDGETLSGTVDITWSLAEDTWGHTKIYTIYYSSNEGTTWIQLATGLTSTSYPWDTTTIPDGLKYMLEVNATCGEGLITESLSKGTFIIHNGPSVPTISSPNGGETLSGTVTIEWSSSLDVFNHTLTYSVYYSSNNGATWTQLVTGLTSTNYSWNTTTVPNGFSNLIKVVVTCSEGNTAEDISDGTFAIQNILTTSTTTSIASSSTTSVSIPGLAELILILGVVTVIIMRKRKNTPLSTTDLIKDNPNIRSPTLYVDRNTPIIITSDAQLSDGTYPGAGTIGNPYRIENWNITTSSTSLISISNTTLYFSIANNSLNGLSNTFKGIQLENVTNGVVKNNTIMNLQTEGISLESSKHNDITNNTVFNINGNGIFVNISNDNTISYNTIYNNSLMGLRIDSSNNNLIANNTVFDPLADKIQIGLFWSRNNTIIGNNVFNGNNTGIFLGILAVNNTVSHNTAFNNTHGIAIVLADNNTVVNNNASHNTKHGIWVRRTETNVIRNNNVTNNNRSGIYLSLSDNTIISNNSVTNNNESGIFLDVSNNTIIRDNNVTSNNEGGILLNSSSNNLIENNIAYENNEDGIWLIRSKYNNISSNTVFNNTWNGISVLGSSHNYISKNYVSYSVYVGIRLDYDWGNNIVCDNNTLIDNIVYRNNEDGLSLYFADNNTMIKNTIYENRWNGIDIGTSNFCLIKNNTIDDNSENGIRIWGNSNNNTICNNTVYNNNLNGINVDYL
jgi:parallel beta-helix repeat protein